MTDSLLMEIIRQDASDFIPRTFNRGPYDGPIEKYYKVSMFGDKKVKIKLIE